MRFFPHQHGGGKTVVLYSHRKWRGEQPAAAALSLSPSQGQSWTPAASSLPSPHMLLQPSLSPLPPCRLPVLSRPLLLGTVQLWFRLGPLPSTEHKETPFPAQPISLNQHCCIEQPKHHLTIRRQGQRLGQIWGGRDRD